MAAETIDPAAVEQVIGLAEGARRASRQLALLQRTAKATFMIHSGRTNAAAVGIPTNFGKRSEKTRLRPACKARHSSGAITTVRPTDGCGFGAWPVSP